MVMSRRQKMTRDQRRAKAQKSSEKMTRNFEPTVFKLPDGVEMFKLREGTPQKFDVIPFVTGEGNPEVDGPGEEFFTRKYAIHKIPRADDKFDRYCCLWETFKERCPICDHRNQRGQDKGIVDALRPQIRRLFLVNDKPGDPKNALKILDAVQFNRKLGFGEQLQKAMQAIPDGLFFWFLDEGMTVQVMVEDEKYGSVSRIDLIPRKYKYPDDLVEQTPCLDDLLIKQPQSILLEALGQHVAPDVSTAADLRRGVDGKARESIADRFGPPDTPAEPKKEEPKKEEPKEVTVSDVGVEEGDTVIYKKREYKITRVSGDGTSLTLTNADGKVVKGVGPDEVELIEDDDDVDEGFDDDGDDD